MSSLIFWPLFVGLAPTGCAGYPDDLVGSDELFSDDVWQNDSFAEILPDQGLSGNGTGETDPDALDVNLSAPLNAASDEFVEIEASVTNAADGDLYYLWEYALDDNAELAAKPFAQIAQADDYVKDWNTLRFYPQDLLPDMVLDGAILHIRAHALEIGEQTREGFGDRLLTIRGYPHTEVDQDEQPEEEEAEEETGDDDNEQVEDGAERREHRGLPAALFLAEAASGRVDRDVEFAARSEARDETTSGRPCERRRQEVEQQTAALAQCTEGDAAPVRFDRERRVDEAAVPARVAPGDLGRGREDAPAPFVERVDYCFDRCAAVDDRLLAEHFDAAACDVLPFYAILHAMHVALLRGRFVWAAAGRGAPRSGGDQESRRSAKASRRYRNAKAASSRRLRV